MISGLECENIHVSKQDDINFNISKGAINYFFYIHGNKSFKFDLSSGYSNVE